MKSPSIATAAAVTKAARPSPRSFRPLEVRDADQQRAADRVEHPVAVRLAAEERDARPDRELRERRMRIHELLAAQVVLPLLDEVHLVEDQLVRLPEMPEAQPAGGEHRAAARPRDPSAGCDSAARRLRPPRAPGRSARRRCRRAHAAPPAPAVGLPLRAAARLRATRRRRRRDGLGSTCSTGSSSRSGSGSGSGATPRQPPSLEHASRRTGRRSRPRPRRRTDRTCRGSARRSARAGCTRGSEVGDGEHRRRAPTGAAGAATAASGRAGTGRDSARACASTA